MGRYLVRSYSELITILNDRLRLGPFVIKIPHQSQHVKLSKMRNISAALEVVHDPLGVLLSSIFLRIVILYQIVQRIKSRVVARR